MKLKDAELLARRLIAEHGLTDWDFGFDYRKPGGRRPLPRKLRLGFCSFGGEWFDHIGRDQYRFAQHKPKISLLAPFVEAADESMVQETLLHEIGHALAGKAHRHDKVWKETVVRIGGRLEPFCVLAFDLILPQIAKRFYEKPGNDKQLNSQGKLF